MFFWATKEKMKFERSFFSFLFLIDAYLDITPLFNLFILISFQVAKIGEGLQRQYEIYRRDKV